MEPFKVSASQLKTAFDPSTGCLRKWAFGKIEGLRSPSTSAQILGSKMHEVGENYLQNGTVPNLKRKPDRIFASGMHLLPRREDVLGVELGFDLRFDDEVVFHGFIDFYGAHFAGDHKSTSNFRYMMSPEKLQTDPQGVIYGMKVAELFGLDLKQPLDLIWVYYLTRGKPAAKKVHATTNKAQLQRTYYPLAEQARTLVRLKKTHEKALDVEPNYRSCGAYGGCPFASKCESNKNRSAYAGLRLQQKGEENMSEVPLLERLQNRAKAKKEATPAPTETVEVPSVVAINPPSPPSPPSPAVEPKPVQAEPVAKKDETKPKKRRGRPKGSKNKPKPSPAVTEALETMTQTATAPALPDQEATATCDTVKPEYAEKPSQDATNDYILFINCMPSSGGHDITDRLSQIAKQCAYENEVTHYRLIKFGAGPGKLSELVSKSLTEHPLQGMIVVMDSYPMVRDCIEVLIEQAKEVVRAIR